MATAPPVPSYIGVDPLIPSRAVVVVVVFVCVCMRILIPHRVIVLELCNHYIVVVSNIGA